jgi:branched-chain amino acid transport system permease protein
MSSGSAPPVTPALDAAISILFHGLALASVLYLVSVGLSVTMGLMGVVNLAHGVFAVAGGYLTVTIMRDLGTGSFPLAILVAVTVVAAASVPIEMLLYRRLYGRSDLEQVLLTIGLAFMSVAAAKYVWGPLSQPFQPPAWLSGQITVAGRDFPTYRSFLILSGALTALLLWLALERTRFGARIRAAVDNRRMAQSLGIDTGRLFTAAFALGSGLAALGGGLGAEILAVQPAYALQYLVYFLITVSVGGLGSIRGPFVAAILLGVADTGFKYLLPEFGAFFIYALTMLLLLWRPNGLFGRA